MKRIIVAGLVGGIVYFAWGMAAWMFLGLHKNTIQPLPDDASVTTALTSRALETGVYGSPYPADASAWQDPESDFMKAHLAGPIYTIYFEKSGSAPMGTDTLLGGLVIDVLSAMLAACLLTSALTDCRSYAHRVGFVVGLGIFVALVGHAAYWNWMRFPTAYTIHFIVDYVVGWTLTGLAIAAIVRPGGYESVTPASTAAVAAPPAAKAASVKTAKPASQPAPKPTRNDAITLLATLQREARFVDIVKEPLSDYSDAQVGAAAHDVLRDCGAVLDRLFELQPVVDQTEGSTVDLPRGFDADRYRITGNVSGEAPYSGPLVHHGWEAKKCSLPQWSGSSDAARIVAPAELEVK